MTNMDSNVVFGFYARSGFEVQSLLLVRSLRAFGGDMANLPVWLFYPENSPLAPSALEELTSLGVICRTFEVEENFLKFPFAGKAAASAAAEGLAEREGLLLAWHDRTGIICQPPRAFQLPEDKVLGFRPTDIANIGSAYGKPVSPFWTEICSQFGFNAEDLPAITTCIDRQRIHLYVNAGLLVVRPERGILRKWTESFKKSYNLPNFKRFYRENQANAIFMHQAVLTAAVVKTTKPQERWILPEHYLFSVDNFFDYAPELRPESLDQIVTGRFHDFFSLENWEEKIIASSALINWFHEQLKDGPYWPKGSL